MSLSIFDEQQAINPIATIALADGTTPVSLVQAPARGLRLDQLTLTNADTIAHDVQITIFTGATAVLGTVAVPAGAGMSAAVPAVDAIPILAPVLAGVVVANGASVYVAVLVAMTAAGDLQALGLGGLF
jgi:hypothetical protein